MEPFGFSPLPPEKSSTYGHGKAEFSDFLQKVAGRNLPLRGPGAQHLQADPGHHGGQRAAEVVHGGVVAAAQPRLLDGVVGIVARPQRSEGDRPEVLPVGLEALGWQVTVTSSGSPSSYYRPIRNRESPVPSSN